MILTLSYSHWQFVDQIRNGDKTQTTRPLSRFIIDRLNKNPTLRHYWKQRTKGRFIIHESALKGFYRVHFSPKYIYLHEDHNRTYRLSDAAQQEYVEQEGFDNYSEFYQCLLGMYGQENMDIRIFVCIKW